MSGSSGWRRSGGTGRARYSETEFLRKSIEVIWHCRSASARPFGCFDGSAAADLPGLRPFRRGRWRLAQGAVVRSMLLLENRLHFLTNSGWCTRTRSGCEIFFAFALNFACGSWKQAQGNCTHVSAVIGGEGVRAESPAQIGGLAGRHEGCRIHIFTTKHVYLKFSIKKLRQNRQAGRRAVWARILRGKKVYRNR